MEIANTFLRLNKVGSGVPLLNITPAEAVLLHILHQGNNGGSTFGEEFEKINVILGPDKKPIAAPSLSDVKKPRTDAEELKRLLTKYGHLVTKKGDKIVRQIWPGTDVKLPQTFDAINWQEVSYDGSDIAPLNLATGQPVTTSK